MRALLIPLGALLFAACSTPQPTAESTLQRSDTLHLDLRENMAAQMRGVEIVHDTIRIQEITIERQVQAAATQMAATEATVKESTPPTPINYTPMWIFNIVLGACLLAVLIFRR